MEWRERKEEGEGRGVGTNDPFLCRGRGRWPGGTVFSMLVYSGW